VSWADRARRRWATARANVSSAAALLRAPDALHRYSSGLERRLQELADADSDKLAAGATPVQAWAIGHALVVGLQIYQRLAPGLVTPEVFERALGLLADLYQEQ
jgi:hypothetical protein